MNRMGYLEAWMLIATVVAQVIYLFRSILPRPTKKICKLTNVDVNAIPMLCNMMQCNTFGLLGGIKEEIKQNQALNQT